MIIALNTKLKLNKNMKKLLFAFLLLFSVHFSFAQDQEAIAYNDKIVTEQTKIAESILSFSNNPNEFGLSQIQKQAEESLNTIKSMKPYKGEKNFLNCAKNLFKFYIDITKNEYKQMLSLITESSKYSEKELVDKVQKLTNSLTKKEKPLDEKFQAAQVAFAEKFNFKLTKNALQEELGSDE